MMRSVARGPVRGLSFLCPVGRNRTNSYVLPVSEKEYYSSMPGEKGGIDGPECPRTPVLLSQLQV